MSAIKTALKSIRGKGAFEEVYDDLYDIYIRLSTYTTKNEMRPALTRVVPKLKKLQEREAEKNQKKLAYLNLIFKGLALWDSQTYTNVFELEQEIKNMNATNTGETIEKARRLLNRIVSELKIGFEAELHLQNLQMRKAQGLGTAAEEAAKNEIFRVAGVKRGGPYSGNNQKRISTVLARKKLGLPLNGSANGELSSLVDKEASLFMAGLMPQVPTFNPSTVSSKGGGDPEAESEKLINEGEQLEHDMINAIAAKNITKKNEFTKRLTNYEKKLYEHLDLYGVDFGKVLFILEVIYDEYITASNQKGGRKTRRHRKQNRKTRKH